MNGALAFVDTSDCTVMNIAEHYMASDVEWDPTGRYVVTSVSWWSHKVDNAYWLWTFKAAFCRRIARTASASCSGGLGPHAPEPGSDQAN